MSYHRLDVNRKPIKKRKGQKPFRDALGRYLYEIIIYRGQKHYQRKRVWLGNDLEAAKYELERKEVASSHRLTWHNGWLRFQEARTDLSDSQIREVDRSVRFLTEFLGDIPIEETSRAQFAEFQQSRKRVSRGATVNKHRRNLLSLAHWLEGQGFIERIPFERIPPVGEDDSRPVIPFTVDEFPAYINALKRQHPYFPTMMIALTGARSGAVCGLKEKDIIGEEMILHEKGNRTESYTIDSNLLAIIQQARALKQQEDRTSGYLFLNSRGTPWTPETLYKRVNRDWKAAGLRPKRIHDLRHMFGTLAGRKFVPDMIRAGMGHASRATSERYVHPDKEKAEIVRADVRATIVASLQQDSSCNVSAITDTKNG